MIGAIISTIGNIAGGLLAQRGANKAADHQSQLAISQMEESTRLRQEALDNRTDYKTPAEISAMVADAQRESAAGSEITRAASDQANQNLANRTGQIQRSATSGAQALAAVNAGADQALDTVTAAEVDQAQLDQQKKAALAQAQTIAAGYKDKEYEKNVQQEFDRVYGESQALRGASLQNEAGAINTRAQGKAALGQAIGGAASSIAENVDFSQIFGRRGVQGQMQERELYKK